MTAVASSACLAPGFLTAHSLLLPLPAVSPRFPASASSGAPLFVLPPISACFSLQPCLMSPLPLDPLLLLCFTHLKYFPPPSSPSTFPFPLHFPLLGKKLPSPSTRVPVSCICPRPPPVTSAVTHTVTAPQTPSASLTYSFRSSVTCWPCLLASSVHFGATR